MYKNRSVVLNPGEMLIYLTNQELNVRKSEEKYMKQIHFYEQTHTHNYNFFSLIFLIFASLILYGPVYKVNILAVDKIKL